MLNYTIEDLNLSLFTHKNEIKALVECLKIADFKSDHSLMYLKHHVENMEYNISQYITNLANVKTINDAFTAGIMFNGIKRDSREIAKDAVVIYNMCYEKIRDDLNKCGELSRFKGCFYPFDH